MSSRFSPRTIMVGGVLLVVPEGQVMPLQARINGEMGIRLQDAVAAAPVVIFVAAAGAAADEGVWFVCAPRPAPAPGGRVRARDDGHRPVVRQAIYIVVVVAGQPL